MKPILLFDLGETLVQYYNRQQGTSILWKCIQAAKKELERSGHIVPSDSAISRGFAAENYEASNYRVRPLRKRLGRVFSIQNQLSVAEWDPICRSFLGPIFSISKIYDDALQVLDELRSEDYRIGILSNCPWGAPGEPWFEELKRHGLAKRCELAVFCSEVGWRKPAQPIFRKALRHFGCKPQECVYVGDNPRWDVQGARRANMVPDQIDRNGQNDITSELVIQSLFDLKQVLSGLDRSR